MGPSRTGPFTYLERRLPDGRRASWDIKRRKRGGWAQALETTMLACGCTYASSTAEHREEAPWKLWSS